MSRLRWFSWWPLFAATLSFTVVSSSCGSPTEAAVDPSTLSAPAGLGQVDAAPVADEATVPPYVDFAATNQRGDARYATRETNAGVRVVAGFLDLWTPSTLLVDAAAAAPAQGSFPAVVASTWTGVPGDATDGTPKNPTVLGASLQYVVEATHQRTAEQALAAYVDDRRGKGYSVTDGLGPLTEAWRAAAQQTTSITEVPADAATVKYDDKGNNTGVGGGGQPDLRRGGRLRQQRRHQRLDRAGQAVFQVRPPVALEPRGPGACDARAGEEPHAQHRRQLHQRARSRGDS